MRLHRSQLPSLARSIIKDLVDHAAIEVTSQAEAAQDVEAVLGNYLDQEREAGEQARDLVQQRGLPQGEFARAKHIVGGEPPEYDESAECRYYLGREHQGQVFDVTFDSDAAISIQSLKGGDALGAVRSRSNGVVRRFYPTVVGSGAASRTRKSVGADGRATGPSSARISAA